MTIVQSDLAELTSAQQELLYSFCVRSRLVLGLGSRLNSVPLILASAKVPLARLILEKSISMDLAFEIQRCVLEVDRLPAQPKLLREALELLLEPGVNL